MHRAATNRRSRRRGKASGRSAGLLERFASLATRWSGGSLAFGLALAVIAVWAVSGPFFGFSDTWQLVINTGTTIVTFLMVFLIQRSQNKDSEAIQLKLNEIVAALEGASNRLVNAESLSEEKLKLLREHYREIARLSREDPDLTRSHSVEEARARHTGKHGRARG